MAPILGCYAFDSEDFWASHPEMSEMFFTTNAFLCPNNPDPQVVAFQKAYSQVNPGSTRKSLRLWVKMTSDW